MTFQFLSLEPQCGRHFFTPKMTPAPGVVILQEIFGVNEFVKWIAARLAEDGFTVIAPDLYQSHRT